MKLLAIIDIPTGRVVTELPPQPPAIERVAVRAIATGDDGQICLMHVAKRGYYKLPGGGVDAGESLVQALNREMLEETGYTVVIDGEVGTVIQVNTEKSYRHTSHVYRVRITGGTGQPRFTPGEAADGFAMIKVANLSAAIELMSTQSVANDMTVRDLIILRAANHE